MAHGEMRLFHSYGLRVYPLAAWVILFWFAITAVTNLCVPLLEKTIAEYSVPFFPSDNSGIVALEKMSQSFGKDDSSGIGTIILEDKYGINELDSQYYGRLVNELVKPENSDKIAYIYDVYSQPAIRNIAESKDHQAIVLTVILKGKLGTSQVDKAWSWLTELLKSPDLAKPNSLQAYFTGPAPVFVQELRAIDSAMLKITAVSVVLITILLFIVYRSIVTIMVPLINIGISLALARVAISYCGSHGLMEISTFSNTVATAVVLGAGTDYAVFLIGRYHEARLDGVYPREALAIASGKISGVLIASGLTIGAASCSMYFTKIGFFRTSGLPIALAIMITLIVSLTLTPALMALAIRYGKLEPRVEKKDSQYWRKCAILVLRKPIPICIGVITFLLLASFPLIGAKTNYNEPTMQPANNATNQGLKIAALHYPQYYPFTEYVFFTAEHDIRNSRDLAAIELASNAIANVSGVENVQSITRPDGQPMAETSLAYQEGVLGKQLANRLQLVDRQLPLLKKLAEGTAKINDSFVDMLSQLPDFGNGTDGLIKLADSVFTIAGSADDLIDKTNAGQMPLHGLLLTIRDEAEGILQVLHRFGPDVIAKITKARDFYQDLINSEPGEHCRNDLICMAARLVFAKLDTITNGQASSVMVPLLHMPEHMKHAYKLLIDSTPHLMQINTELTQMADQLGDHTPHELQNDFRKIKGVLHTLSRSLSSLTDGLLQIKNGTSHLYSQIKSLRHQLGQAAEFLLTTQSVVSRANGGFYMPPQAFSSPRYIQGKSLLISPDGRTARIFVTFKQTPFSNASMDLLPVIHSAAHDAFRETSLENVTVYSTGTAGIFSDLRHEVSEDFSLLMVVALVSVFIILVLLLHSIVAPAIMLLAVLLSLGCTIGITVFVSQYLLGTPLHWSVIPIVFMVVIAVGADYSMLFASRIREESIYGFNRGIMRGFTTTGSVITTAGVVFAVTSFAILAGGIIHLAQIGFAIGMGLLIDITVVRTLLVPAIFVLLRDKVWWPGEAVITTPKHNKKHLNYRY